MSAALTRAPDPRSVSGVVDRDEKGKRVRLFIALDLPAEVRAGIVAWGGQGHRRGDEGADARQELEKSTTTLAKTLHWASRLLCVPTKELYVVPEAEAREAARSTLSTVRPASSSSTRPTWAHCPQRAARWSD